MGNAGAIADWLSPNGSALRHESAWRGPRRLHAVFTTKAHFQATTVEKIKITKGTVWPYRHVTDVTGLIRLRLANGHTEELPTEGGIGWQLVRKAKSPAKYPGNTEIDTSRPDQIARWVPAPFTSLGTDGFGFSDTRPAARRFFHVDGESITLAVLSQLARRGEVKHETLSQAIGKYRLDHPVSDLAAGR